jgi:hypothetical protein
MLKKDMLEEKSSSPWNRTTTPNRQSQREIGRSGTRILAKVASTHLPCEATSEAE